MNGRCQNTAHSLSGNDRILTITTLNSDLTLSVALDDFSGPAKSTSFPLGSFIPIMASVEQMNHQPLLLLLEECVAAATPELQPESNLYPIITNKGYSYDDKNMTLLTLFFQTLEVISNFIIF